MSKIFQNELESEISAGFYNGESLEGLYFNGEYFQIASKLTVFYGRFVMPNGIEDEDLTAINNATDEQIATMVTGVGEVPNTVSDELSSFNFVGKTPFVEVEFPKEELETDSASTYFFAFPKKALPEGSVLRMKSPDETFVYTTPTPREVTINVGGKDIVYNVYYGFANSMNKTTIKMIKE